MVLSNIGRIPGVIVSTYAADGLVDGRIWQSVVIFVVAAVIAVLGIAFKDKIMDVVGKASKGKDE